MNVQKKGLGKGALFWEIVAVLFQGIIKTGKLMFVIPTEKFLLVANGVCFRLCF